MIWTAVGVVQAAQLAADKTKDLYDRQLYRGTGGRRAATAV